MGGIGEISFNIQSSGGNVLIDIKDTGKGIAKKHFKDVFKPGFTTKQRGWGLGLSLSKRICNGAGKITTIRILIKVRRFALFRMKAVIRSAPPWGMA